MQTCKSANRRVALSLAIIFAIFADLEGSLGFSLSSEKIFKGKSDFSREDRVSVSHYGDGVGRLLSGTALNVAVSTSPVQVLEVPVIGKMQKNQLESKLERQLRTGNVPVGTINYGASMSTRKQNRRMLRPASRSSSPRLNGRATRSEVPSLLSKEEEQRLTSSIGDLRKVVHAREQLVEGSGTIPSEYEWADACEMSVLKLRKVMYEGQQARTVLVSANAGLVTSIAKRHYAALTQATRAGGGVGTILTMQDLIQEGNLGLMQAAERFEAERGNRFSTYATYWIRQRILRSISDSSRIIRLPAHGTSFC